MVQASFKAMTRNEYFDKHVKNPDALVPVGHYRTRFGETDAKVSGPVYGKKSRWDGHSRIESKKIKDFTFHNSVHKCERLDKTLCYKRTAHIPLIRSPQPENQESTRYESYTARTT